jgi:hypothetical protein
MALLRSDMQRSLTAGVSNIDIRAAGEQKLNDALLSGAAG